MFYISITNTYKYNTLTRFLTYPIYVRAYTTLVTLITLITDITLVYFIVFLYIKTVVRHSIDTFPICFNAHVKLNVPNRGWYNEIVKHFPLSGFHNRELKQSSCRTATAVNKQLNFRVKRKPQTTEYVYVLHI